MALLNVPNAFVGALGVKPGQELRPIAGNGISVVIPHINIVRIAKAVNVIIERIPRHILVFTTCTIVPEELLSKVSRYSSPHASGTAGLQITLHSTKECPEIL